MTEARGAAVGPRDAELAQRQRRELGGAVEQVLQVRRGEGQGVGGGIELRCDAPAGVAGRLEPDARRPVVEAPCPEERRGHVQVRVRRVDGEVGPVGVIAVDAVPHADRAVVDRDVPLIRVRPRRGQLGSLRVVRAQLEHVLPELVDRVPSGRRAAHAELERPVARHVGKRHLDFHPAMLGLRKGQPICDSQILFGLSSYRRTSEPSVSDPPPLFELRRGLAGALAKAGAWSVRGWGPSANQEMMTSNPIPGRVIQPSPFAAGDTRATSA